jgi:hypothetical protein
MAVGNDGDGRFPLQGNALQDARAAEALILDERRQRPNYFDGRFLTAADLTSDQNYLLSRLTDLARTLGKGVSEGLMVRLPDPELPTAGPGSLWISAGWGLTGAGELVGLPKDRQVDVGALARIQELNQRFGLAELPAEPQRTLTGLFVLALRPVEFTDGPIASYPTGVTGQRQVEDGFIVEATAITLLRYGDGGPGSGEEQRSRVARETFLSGEVRLDATGVLPLALVALSRGVVLWVDNWLVRRELGAEAGGSLGLFGASRARRQAHLQHYRSQLEEVLQQRQRQGRGWQFAAAEHFALLPPVGPLPREAILLPPGDTNGDSGGEAFQQVYFPPEIEADLVIVPEDELPAVIEESLALPSIDLTLSPAERDAIAVLILLPVPRARLQSLLNSLARFRKNALRRPLLPAAPGQISRRRPLEMLEWLGPAGFGAPLGDADSTALVSATADAVAADGTGSATGLWREELRGVQQLWFVRRRQFPDRQNVVLLTEARP